MSSPFFFVKFSKLNVFKKILFIYFLYFYHLALLLNPFKDNKFYYKNGYQRVQLDVENEKSKNIHPVKINPLKIEGALKLIVTKWGEIRAIISKRKISALFCCY